VHQRTPADVAESEEDRGYSLEDAARRIGVGRSMVYELIASGELDAIRIGRRRIVPGMAIRAYMKAKIEEARAERTPAAV
jgi:excisionase family DNA binding protein